MLDAYKCKFGKANNSFFSFYTTPTPFYSPLQFGVLLFKCVKESFAPWREHHFNFINRELFLFNSLTKKKTYFRVPLTKQLHSLEYVLQVVCFNQIFKENKTKKSYLQSKYMYWWQTSRLQIYVAL